MSRRRPGPAPVQVLALLSSFAVATSGCGAGGAAPAEEQLTVLAAASLTEPFTVLAERFEEAHGDVDVVVSFDSSATVATQVTNGAAADLVATADPRTMQVMEEAGVLAGSPVEFARNRMTLVVPPDNPADIADVTDLDGTDFVVCAPAVPCGVLAEAVIDGAGVSTRPRSHEVDVKAVLTKVVLGEADAGLVYASDAVAAGDRVREITLPRGIGASTTYPAAVTRDAPEPELAAEFLDLVRSEEGQQVLAGSGFDVVGRP